MFKERRKERNNKMIVKRRRGKIKRNYVCKKMKA